jgi:TP901 family phage tail tape measure protein
MQQLLASLVTTMSVKDAAFESGMKAASARAKRTEQDLERSTDRMGSAVERAADRINLAMVKAGESVAAVGDKVARAGVAMTAGITVPIALIGKRTKDTAADFESAMNRVRAAMLDASSDQLRKLSDAAMKLGPAMGRSSIEAAGAVEMLAKNGMSAAAILNGGLASALKLAVVGQTDLAGAADLTTDVVAQFGKSSADLPGIVDRVSGALDVSKMGFDDYRLAIGQAGGVAGGLGVSFEDLNVALAATASYFASGSDAGTSYKTFLTSLSGNSKEATKMIKDLRLEFFDASGNAKGLGAIAEELRNKVSGLNDVAKQDALKTIFGTDAMRTAIALMNQGAAGIDRYRAAIDKVTAAQKMDVLLDGDAAASARMAAAAENLSIKLGEVLLPVFTAVKNGVAAVLGALGSAPEWFYTVATAAALLAASIGPLTVAMVTLAKVALPLLLLRLGPIGLAFGALVNPVGTILLLLGRLAAQAGAATVLGMLGTRLVALAGPLGIAVTLMGLLWPLLFKTATASDAVRKAQDAASAAMDRGRERSLQLATATGQLRKELIAKAKADGAAAVAALKKSVADMAAARAALTRAKAERASIEGIAAAQGGTAPGAIGSTMRQRADDRVANAEADLRGSIDVVKTWNTTVQGLIADVRNASAADSGGQTLPADGDSDKKAGSKSSGPKGKTAEDRAREQAQYEDELGRIRVATLAATADLTEAISSRHAAEVAAIEEERASYARSVALDDGLDDAKRAVLIAAKEGELEQRRQLVDQQRSARLAQQQYDLDKAANEAAQETVRAEMDLADSAAGRRDVALRLLELQRRQEEADLDLILATEATSSAAWSNASARKDQLDGIYAQRKQQVDRDNEGPLASYRRELNKSAQAVQESIEAIEVSGFERLNDWMTDAVMGADNLAKAFGNMARSIIADLVRIMIQQQLIKPLADALGGGFLKGLFGGGSGSADLFGQGNALKSFTPDLAGLSYAGGKASGGRVGPGNWYMVGENGPEPFVPDTAGTIHPAASMRSGRGGEATVRIIEDAGFATRVVGISGQVSVQTARASSRRAVMQNRQRLK